MQSTSTQTLAQTLAELQLQGLDRLDAQLLLLHVLGQPSHQRGWLLAHDTDMLALAPAARLKTLTMRRLTGEPLAYLTGHKEFFGLDLQVDARVLVPRPDTETLVDWALAVLHAPPETPSTQTDRRALPQNSDLVEGQAEKVQIHPLGGQHVLDLGTGSGAIALALKASSPTLQVHAVDLSAEALVVAEANAQHLQLEVSFSQGTWFEGLTNTACAFDCIVSNPPYIAARDPHLEALIHEPLNALASGPDGLDDLRHIIAEAPKHLKPGGWLLLEHGYDQAQAVRDLLARAGFHKTQSRRDLNGIERCSGGQHEPLCPDTDDLLP